MFLVTTSLKLCTFLHFGMHMLVGFINLSYIGLLGGHYLMEPNHPFRKSIEPKVFQWKNKFKLNKFNGPLKFVFKYPYMVKRNPQSVEFFFFLI
jgi:hypothetical protein